MRSLKSVLFALAMSAAVSAHAGAGSTTTTVKQLTDIVSFGSSSTGFTSYIGYSVQISNGGTNTINNIVFRGSNTPTAGDPAAYAFVTGANPPACSAFTPAGSTVASGVSCQIGQLKSGASVQTFYLYFLAPDQPASTNAVTLSFSGATIFAEGTNDQPSSVPANSSEPWQNDQVALGTPNPSNIKSAVPKTDNSLGFFTAANQSGDLSDQITTKLTIPPLTQQTSSLDYAGVSIQETPFFDTDCQNARNFNTCYTTEVHIQQTSSAGAQLLTFPQSGPYIYFEIRIDPAAIKPSFKATDAKIYYISDDGLTITGPIGLCDNGYPLPCAVSINYYKKTGPTPDLDGVFQAIIKNDHNGSIRLF